MEKIQKVNLVDVQLGTPLNLASLYIHPFRSRLSPRLRVFTPIVGETMTKQQFKDECDVNNILKQYASTGIMPHVNKTNPTYLDLSNTETDYLQTMNQIYDAQDAFSQLPATVRKRFDNSPISFLDFAMDPKNADELVSLGLATKREPLGAGVSPAAGGSQPAGGSTPPA
jgi:phage internal scaffolding protein